jgi:hypothetical protein
MLIKEVVFNAIFVTGLAPDGWAVMLMKHGVP